MIFIRGDKMELAEALKREDLRFDLSPQHELLLAGFEIKTPEDFKRLEEFFKQHSGSYFYVDVWNCTARLCLMENRDDGSGTAYAIDDYEQHGITYDELVDAVEEAGGAINWSGAYPINQNLREKLMKLKQEIS